MTAPPTYEELRASRQEAWGQIYELKKQVKMQRTALRDVRRALDDQDRGGAYGAVGRALSD